MIRRAAAKGSFTVIEREGTEAEQRAATQMNSILRGEVPDRREDGDAPPPASTQDGDFGGGRTW